MKTGWMTAIAVTLMTLQLTGCVPVVVAGAGAGVAVAADRRTSATYMSDEEIELRASNRINTVFPADNVHVSCNSYNRTLLLTGEVPDAATRDRIEQLVREVPDVASVHDAIEIGPPTTLSQRSDDLYLAAKIHTRFINAKTIPDGTIKVIVDRGVVYLMGFVTHQEGDQAAYVASVTDGVKSVVKLFEYQ